MSSTIPYSSSTGKSCIDLTPYAVNPEFLSILQNTTGDVPNDAAVYFNIPSKLAAGEYIYCLENIVIPESVGGNVCNTTSETSCWLAVGYRHGSSSSTDKKKEEEVDNSHFGCVCSGSTMNNFTFPQQSVADGCGVEAEDRWGLGCRDSNHGRLIGDFNGTTVYSAVANAYISVCPEVANYCGVCGSNGAGVVPSFVVGVQWVSNLEEQCGQDAFSTYQQPCSKPRFSTTSIVAMVVGGSVLLIVVLSLFSIHRKAQAPKSRQLPSPKVAETDVEKQRNSHNTPPPVPVISITSDGSSTN